jgi:hypothetical protein
MEQIMFDHQVEVAHLVPGAKHVIAETSGHNIHQDQPELVIEAIRMVVDAVRDPSTWTAYVIRGIPRRPTGPRA